MSDRFPTRPSAGSAGSVAVTVAITLAAVIGMASLGVEITSVLLTHRQMQAAADSAAMAAAAALAGGNKASMLIEADAVASGSGFTPGVSGTTIAVNNPPASGLHAGSASAVEVILGQPQKLYLSRVFFAGSYDVNVRAVALVGSAGGYCILQVDSAAAVGVNLNNGASASLTTCGLAVNSQSSVALSMTGGATIASSNVSVAGGATISNGAAITPSTALKTAQPTVIDPYASVAQPTFSGCGAGTAKSYGWGSWTLSPGVYCNGIAFNNGATATMNPGLYIVDRGTFDVEGGAHLTGTGVTIFLTSSTGSGYAKTIVGNGATIVLSAPTSGTTAGMVFFGDRRGPKTNSNTLTGGVAINVTGALYFPSQALTFENGSSNPSSCTQLVAGSIQLTGGSKFQNNCPTGVKTIGAASSKLVE